RYQLAAEIFRHRFDDYPRTSDGGFWHATNVNRQWQLWADGAFMGMEFLIRYGEAFGDSKYTNDEAAKQILVYASHLRDPNTGLLFHAYDESGKQPWADPTTHHSAEFWGRAMGWFGMVTVDLLDVLPRNHPKRAELISFLQRNEEHGTGLGSMQQMLPAPRSFTVQVRNPTARARVADDIIVTLNEVRNAAPGLNPDFARLSVRNGGKDIDVPFQADDLDG